jgi:uncharacterized membrane protein
MITVTLFTRADCHLCDQTKADLEGLQSKYPHRLVEVDVDSDQSLQRKYGEILPVVEVGPYRKKAPISQKDLMITLGAAVDREKHLQSIVGTAEGVQAKRSRQITRSDRFSFWFSKNYVWVLNLAVFIYVGLPFLAPVLMVAGAKTPANLIYRSYGFVCHQLAFRSWFLFGEQVAYPREAAGVPGIESFGSATGLSEGNSSFDLLTARNFIGNDEVGYKVAFCERDVAIYAAILLFGLIYAFSGRRLPALPWYLWVLVGMAPIGLDGFSQLLSQPPFGLWAYRESSPFLRTLTGGLFGFTTAWFGFPLVNETMQDARRALLVKFRRLEEITSL